WIADPHLRTLQVFRLTPYGYLVALTAQAGQRVRAEPFDAVELESGVLFAEPRAILALQTSGAEPERRMGACSGCRGGPRCLSWAASSGVSRRPARSRFGTGRSGRARPPFR